MRVHWLFFIRSALLQVCRCVPMLVEQFDLGEVTNKHKLRRVVADRFQGQKGLTNPDVRLALR